MKTDWKLLTAARLLVIGAYVYMAQSGVLELVRPNAAQAYYNLLVQGFRAGHLSLNKDVPMELTQLADPYDPIARARYPDVSDRLLDLSYYKGRLYLYFGVTPALILFWPYVALTGHYLFHRQAVTIFCALGFLVSVGLLQALWRRYFADVSKWTVAACALALGLAAGLPGLLSQSDVYEVPISCGYTLTMLTLAAIWCALHRPEHRCRWLAVASAAYGLAIGARPNLLFGAAILSVPVICSWRERQPESRPCSTWLPALLAATVPILLIVLTLMLYNNSRFDSPFEFGQHYQLAGQRQVTQQNFSPRYLWFNLRVYFLEPARWGTRFPFVHGMVAPRLPAGYTQVRNPFGILPNIPMVWLALVVPLAWRNRSEPAGTVLRGFVAAVTTLFAACALTLLLFCSANLRYEVDFLPPLLLLAVVGVLGLERILADRPRWRHVARCGWGLLLAFSVAFNFLASVDYHADAHARSGAELFGTGRIPEAIEQYRQALRLEPEHARAHNNLGVALTRLNRLQEAIEQYEMALRSKPDYAAAHNNLAFALWQTGRTKEAIEHYEIALRLDPQYAEPHADLATVLAQLGNTREAIHQYELALQIKPDFPEAENGLGVALLEQNNPSEAVKHLQHVLHLKPGFAEAHYNLASALEQTGDLPEAIAHYEQALRISPDYTDASNALARLQPKRAPTP